MNKNLTMKELSRKILSKPYWSLEKLKDELNISNEQLNIYLEEINERYEEIGISLDVVTIKSVDYLVPLIESTKPFLSNLQVGLLVIFSLKVKMEGGSLQGELMANFINNYYEEFEFFLQNKLVNVENNSVWFLTPLGAAIVFPYLEDTIPFIEKLLLSGNK